MMIYKASECAVLLLHNEAISLKVHLAYRVDLSTNETHFYDLFINNTISISNRCVISALAKQFFIISPQLYSQQ